MVKAINRMAKSTRRSNSPVLREAVLEWIDRMKPDYDATAKYIWENPELSLVEYRSSARLMGWLKKNGFQVKAGICGMDTAFVASSGSGKPVIGFLAEYDALPNLSQQPGCAVARPIHSGAPGHGCAHNLYGASSVTAAIAAAQAVQKYGIEGTVTVFGCPAEETLVGKVYMNRERIFDAADILLSWHPSDQNGADYISYLAMKSAKFQFFGRSAHGAAAPDHGRNALSAVQLMNAGVSYMREHVVQEARIHNVISSGGETPNNVPPFAENYYFIRAPRTAQLDEIWNWMLDIAQGAALMTQTKMRYELLTAIYERLSNRTLARMGDEIARSIGPPPFTPEDQRFGREIIKSLGKDAVDEPFSTRVVSPDFSRTFPDVFCKKATNDQGNLSWRVPLLTFSAATQAKSTPYHSWQMVSQANSPAALKAGLLVSKWLAVSALTLFDKPQIIREAQKELRGYLRDFGKYRDPIPPELKVPTFKKLYGMTPNAAPGPSGKKRFFAGYREGTKNSRRRRFSASRKLA